MDMPRFKKPIFHKIMQFDVNLLQYTERRLGLYRDVDSGKLQRVGRINLLILQLWDWLSEVYIKLRFQCFICSRNSI